MSDPLQDIMEERARQDEKWGEQNHDPYKWMVILAEEYGEACREALEAETAANLSLVDIHLMAYRKELIETAAVALAALESLDRNELPTQHREYLERTDQCQS